MTGTEPHAPRGAAWAQPGPQAAGRRSYTSTHAHLGTAGRGTLWEQRAASGPEELRDSERTYASTHAYLGTFLVPQVMVRDYSTCYSELAQIYSELVRILPLGCGPNY